MIDTIQLFKNYVFVFLKAKMEYRFSFFMDLFAQIFTNSINCICIWILAYQFQNVGGWTFYELLLLYSINLLSFGLGALFFWSPMYSMENLIKQGDFDKMLFRPISPFIYLIISQFDYVFFAHIFLGLFFMMYSIYKLKLIIDILLIFLIIIMVISAVFIQASLLVLCGSINFWYIKSGKIIDILVWGIRKFLEYPITIYGTLIRNILIFIIPYAFTSYYPAAIILDKKLCIGNAKIIVTIMPILGVVLFSSSIVIWHIGLRKYDSTGS